MYSTSKSFTATAVGLAVAEHKLSLADKVISFFPQYLPDTSNPNLAALTVKDVLTMSVGQDPDPTVTTVQHDTNWVKAFLHTSIVYKPGTRFLYNSLGTYMLSAIVQKVTRQKEIDYLKPRLFDPLGISGMDWETDPMGINTGGWGLRIKTEDMAKFGQLFLQNGKWHGRQVLPANWVKEASTKKIDQEPDAPQSRKDSSDWLQGYCYQMWRCRHNAYRGDGAYGQYIIVLPEQDAVIAITSETSNMQDELDLVWKHLLPSLTNKRQLKNGKSENTLQQQLAALTLPVPASGIASTLAASLSGKSYKIDANNNFIQRLSLQFDNQSCTLHLTTDTADFHINFAKEKWAYGSSNMPQPYLITPENGRTTFKELGAFKVAGSYRWLDNNTLECTLRYIESPHTRTYRMHFDGNQLELSIIHSNDFGSKKTVLKGSY